MPGSKYDRELRFIETETVRLTAELERLREIIPDTPLDAEKKAMEIGIIEEKIAEFYARRKEIVDSFIAAGLDPPDVERNLNATVYRNGAAFESHSIGDQSIPGVKAASSSEDLTKEIKDITDELMELEIKMLQAELAGDDAEKQKLMMASSALRSRREHLIVQVKAAAMAKSRSEEKAEPVVDDEFKKKLKFLEDDNRALRSQIQGVRSDVSDIKEQLRQILEVLRMND